MRISNNKMISKKILLKSLKIAERNEEGLYILRYSKIFILPGFFLIILGITCGLIAPYLEEFSSTDYIINAVTSIFLVICGFMVILYYSNYKCILNEEKIEVKNMFLRKDIYWHDLNETSFNKWSYNYILKSNLKKIKIDVTLLEFYTIIWIMKRKANESIYLESLKNLNIFYKKYNINDFEKLLEA